MSSVTPSVLLAGLRMGASLKGRRQAFCRPQLASALCTLQSVNCVSFQRLASSHASQHVQHENAAKIPGIPLVPDAILNTKTDVLKDSRTPLDGFRDAIAKLVSEALCDVGVEEAYSAIVYGYEGLNFAVPLARLKRDGCGDIKAMGERILAKFGPDDNACLESISIHKGHLLIKPRTVALANAVLPQVSHGHVQGGTFQYGRNSSGRGRKVVIQSSSPAIGQAFTSEHRRGTTLAAFLANLYRFCGWEVVSLNKVGDRGTHMGLIGVGFGRYGLQEDLEKDPIKRLYDLGKKVAADAKGDCQSYSDVHGGLYRADSNDSEKISLLRDWRKRVIDQYTTEHARMGFRFDRYTGDTEISGTQASGAMQILQRLNVVGYEEGCMTLDLTEWKLGKVRLGDRKPKAGTYPDHLSDIVAATQLHAEHGFDKLIYVVSPSQRSHYAQLLRILHLMGFPWAAKVQSWEFGDISGMKSDELVHLSEYLDWVSDVGQGGSFWWKVPGPIRERMEDNDYDHGIESMKLIDVAGRRISNARLDWDRLIHSDMLWEGQSTSPQLAYINLCDHLRGRSTDSVTKKFNSDDPLLVHPGVHELIFLLGSYPDVLKTAMVHQESRTVVHFVSRLIRAFESCGDMENKYVRRGKIEVVPSITWLYWCTHDVLKSAMALLTVKLSPP